MCGIWFSVGLDNLPASVIDVIAHRGPDGRGWQEFSSERGPVVMAHRRLAIIDLSESGHQPMSSRDGSLWITFNGEVYNYIEIRKELEALGQKFISQTDTEVILQAYMTWGPECLHRFNGMFALVIWNDR
ncbi:MAG: asparagine synthetase B, partial [Holosporales bacterium]|nr:asparagine synthetase B [Holosporales bacterium]